MLKKFGGEKKKTRIRKILCDRTFTSYRLQLFCCFFSFHFFCVCVANFKLSGSSGQFSIINRVDSVNWSCSVKSFKNDISSVSPSSFIASDDTCIQYRTLVYKIPDCTDCRLKSDISV